MTRDRFRDDLTGPDSASTRAWPEGTHDDDGDGDGNSDSDGDASARVDAVLGPAGLLARAIPHYEDRPGQRRMAHAVASALAAGEIQIIEAGTGTGKTLAYLVPALQSGQRVVVATGTRTLQDQITRHDLPLLRDVLPRPFSAVVLKGVSNYLCLRKFHARAEAAGTPASQTSLAMAMAMTIDRTAHAAHAAHAVRQAWLDRITEWAAHTETGDRAEVAEVADDAPIWAELTTSPENRLGPRCPFYERCFVTRARRRAEKADLVIVNHHLFFADMALRAAHPGVRVLPDYDAVIFDEAHQLEEVITEHFGVRVSTVRLAHFVRDARHVLDSPGERACARVELSSDSFFAIMRRHIVASAPMTGDRETSRIELAPDLFCDPARQDAWFALDNALDELGHHALVTSQARGEAGDDEASEELFGLYRRAGLLRDDLAALTEQASGRALASMGQVGQVGQHGRPGSTSSDAFVYWGEARPGGGVFLGGSPIRVARYVNDHVISAAPSIILTSATLQSGGSFDYFRARLGLDADRALAVAVESPFDYARQAMLYVPRDLPDPREDGFTCAACARVAELLAITAGRAFVLFTSHRALRLAAETLASLVDHPLLVQGQAPRAALIERFRDRPGSVLLGTGAFWEGIDVPGDALSMVIIDKLPFAPPHDPLTAARMRAVAAEDGEPFADYQLPQAALALEQGFGRLIRRSDDRGVVAILDRRLVLRRYGRVFFDTLPPGLPRTSSIEVVRRFFLGPIAATPAAAVSPRRPDAPPDARAGRS